MEDNHSEAINFLKSKGLIAEGYNDFVIRYPDGRPQVSLPSLLAEFVSYVFRDEDDKPILATDEDRRIFAEALINPPEPGEGLRKAQEAYLKSGIIDETN